MPNWYRWKLLDSLMWQGLHMVEEGFTYGWDQKLFPNDWVI
jgi:hypothetical protein